ncbi:uncharacterized protein LOC113643785 isoform X2 [Tachysurus fulvidraco]|uniref:uncharacterized protein LOC113643785 isoform X2 n=1 Tax=Tachysurus fulvidraco TaxID=1234273 RepID=UPI001FEF4FD5|nr:uncharacterized protein LOC113643785 isoform X2 [Tachysurus fulvidraco]
MLQSVAVPLLCLVVCFHQAVEGEAVNSVIGYINESVVLRLQQFSGRLKLNTNTGDLTILNVKAGDSMEYTVYLEGQQNTHTKKNNIQLNVREPFPGPNITLLHSFLDEGTCVIKLRCSHLSSNISLMWKPVFNERFWSDPPNVTRESVMWTNYRNKDVTFICNATDHNLSKSSQLSVKCPETCPSKSCCIWLILILICLLVAIFCIFRGQISRCITACWNFLK